MSGFADYDAYDGRGLAALVTAGEVTAAALVEEAIARAERINPHINAIVEPMYAQARARVADGAPPGPFGGVPFLMKDLGSALAGVPLRNGSRFFRDYVPDYDHTMVARLHAAGLVTIGKSSTPELGLLGTTEPVLQGPTRNPWNLAHTTGGSSGGSAAAVAAGIVPLASAGDGGGSIRIPASCNGLVGLKPSRGRNPSGPVLGESWYGQVQLGVISRSVRDSAAALDATAGGDTGMPYCAPPPPLRFADEVGRDPGRLRIAVCRESLCCEAPIAPACLAALDDCTALLAGLGHELVEAVPDIERMALGRAFM
ncbi:MAG: amidase, partial [Gammaproteobacteria bacterium]